LAREALFQFLLAAMSGASLAPAHALAAKFPWQSYNTFADIGTAQGMVPATLARAHPHLIGAGFDLPEVKPIFDEFIAGRGVSDRVKFLAGNFLTDPSLPSANVLIMGHILHDWDLAQKRMLLEKAFAALPKGGALIVYETMIDDERRENAMGLLMSLNMLIETPGGFDFTGADCQAWMRDAGFSETRVTGRNPWPSRLNSTASKHSLAPAGEPTSRRLAEQFRIATNGTIRLPARRTAPV